MTSLQHPNSNWFDDLSKPSKRWKKITTIMLSCHFSASHLCWLNLKRKRCSRLAWTAGIQNCGTHFSEAVRYVKWPLSLGGVECLPGGSPDPDKLWVRHRQSRRLFFLSLNCSMRSWHAFLIYVFFFVSAAFLFFVCTASNTSEV